MGSATSANHPSRNTNFEEHRIQACFIRRYGSNDVLEYGDLPKPQPGAALAYCEAGHVTGKVVIQVVE
jgi:hypothetical protein